MNCDFPVKTTCISPDVEKKWGKADKTDWIPAKKETYAIYAKYNVVFGFNKGMQIFEAISFDSSLHQISFSLAKETLGSPQYDITFNDQRTIGYTAGPDYKILLVFSQPATGSPNPSLDHYSVLYPQGTVNLMAGDPGRNW